MNKKVRNYYVSVYDSLRDNLIYEIPETFDIESHLEQRTNFLRISEYILREQLRLTPWYLFWRKSFLNLCILYAIEERVKHAEKQKQVI